MILIFLLVFSGFIGGAVWWHALRNSPTPESIHQGPSPITTSMPTPASFNKSLHATDAPGSLWWVVNKQRHVPGGYAPGELVVPDISLRLNRNAEQMQVAQVIAKDLVSMSNAAKVAGYTLVLSSGYRSENLQTSFYNDYVARDGVAAADRYSARPGTSEHQTGLSIDLGRPDQRCQLATCFGGLPEGVWLRDHAHEYGFLIRYPEGKEEVTGYQYEPWHLRYVGRELAAEMHRTGVQTLEEFFDLPAAPAY